MGGSLKFSNIICIHTHNTQQSDMIQTHTHIHTHTHTTHNTQHTAAVTEGGAVWSWGSGDWGQLGTGLTERQTVLCVWVGEWQGVGE